MCYFTFFKKSFHIFGHFFLFLLSFVFGCFHIHALFTFEMLKITKSSPSKKAAAIIRVCAYFFCLRSNYRRRCFL